MNITGTHIAYKIICKRKLWYYINNLSCEHNSDIVEQGKVLHESTYERKQKDLGFGPIKIDWIDMDKHIIHEVKKTNKMENAHIWQLKYYLYYLKCNNITNYTGILNYPKIKKTTDIELTDKDVIEIGKMLKEIEEIANLELPPCVNLPVSVCRKCSYFELCHI